MGGDGQGLPGRGGGGGGQAEVGSMKCKPTI